MACHLLAIRFSSSTISNFFMTIETTLQELIKQVSIAQSQIDHLVLEVKKFEKQKAEVEVDSNDKLKVLRSKIHEKIAAEMEKTEKKGKKNRKDDTKTTKIPDTPAVVSQQQQQQPAIVEIDDDDEGNASDSTVRAVEVDSGDLYSTPRETRSKSKKR